MRLSVITLQARTSCFSFRSFRLINISVPDVKPPRDVLSPVGTAAEQSSRRGRLTLDSIRDPLTRQQGTFGRDGFSEFVLHVDSKVAEMTTPSTRLRLPVNADPDAVLAMYKRCPSGAPLSEVLRRGRTIRRGPNAIVPRCSNRVCVAIRRRSVGVRRVPHHRAAVPGALEVRELRAGVRLSAPRRREQVREEGEGVKSEDERDDPLEDGGDVLPAVKGGGGEDGGEGDLDEDEEELEPEGEAQDAVLAEVRAQALVFGADEDGADDVAGDEEEEEAVVEVGVVEGVEDGEEDEAAGAGDGEDDCGGGSARRRVGVCARGDRGRRTGQAGQDLLGDAQVLGQTPRVPQPALRGEGEVEEDGGNAAACDEQGLQALGPNVGDVRYVLVGAHGGIMGVAFQLPDNQHG